MEKARFVSTLSRWYADHGRDLPWRHTHDPYAVWLSEIIMQQTRVAQGQAYWERFMERFPTVGALAEASEDEVLKLWQGLGYYSRARNLHAAARQIVTLGRFPDTLDGIRRLKGVGDYTAAAIAAFAFGQPAAAVDGNFYRVLSRLFGIETPINSTAGKKLFQALADELMGGDPRVFNSAVMDFGALQCTPKAPDCTRCPFCEVCEAVRRGTADRLPVKLKTVKVKTVRMTYVYVRCQGRVAMRQRGGGDIWQGLWEPVLLDDDPRADDLRQRTESHGTLIAKNVKHVLTHRVVMADFYLLEIATRPPLPPGYIWTDEQSLDQYAIPRLVEILFGKLS